jgi:hypothetical protein
MSAHLSAESARIAKSAKTGKPCAVDGRHLASSTLVLSVTRGAAIFLSMLGRLFYPQGNVRKFKVAIGARNADWLKRL